MSIFFSVNWFRRIRWFIWECPVVNPGANTMTIRLILKKNLIQLNPWHRKSIKSYSHQNNHPQFNPAIEIKTIAPISSHQCQFDFDTLVSRGSNYPDPGSAHGTAAESVQLRFPNKRRLPVSIPWSSVVVVDSLAGARERCEPCVMTENYSSQFSVWHVPGRFRCACFYNKASIDFGRR